MSPPAAESSHATRRSVALLSLSDTGSKDGGIGVDLVAPSLAEQSSADRAGRIALDLSFGERGVRQDDGRRDLSVGDRPVGL